MQKWNQISFSLSLPQTLSTFLVSLLFGTWNKRHRSLGWLSAAGLTSARLGSYVEPVLCAARPAGRPGRAGGAGDAAAALAAARGRRGTPGRPFVWEREP